MNIIVQSPLEVNIFLDLRKEEIGKIPKGVGRGITSQKKRPRAGALRAWKLGPRCR